jgi:tetratricopeptide (TPR) repeat protein
MRRYSPEVFILVEEKRKLGDEEFYRRKWRKKALQISIIAIVILGIASFFLVKSLNASRAYKIGVQLMEEEQYEDAISSFDKALEIRPNFPEASAKKGQVLLVLQRYDEAQEALLVANPEKLNNKKLASDMLNLLGIVSLRQQEYSAAVDEFEKAIALQPSASSYLGLAEALVKQEKDLDKAIEYVDDAIELRPDPSLYTRLYNMKGQAYLISGNNESANEAFLESLSYNDNYIMSYYFLGISYEQTGNIAKAKGAFSKAIELNPDYDEAFDALKALDVAYPDVLPEAVR